MKIAVSRYGLNYEMINLWRIHDLSQPTRNLALEIVRVTEAAALASGRWMGRGEKETADHAAVEAMRLVLGSVDMDGVIVIGEGEKDNAPMLYNGEHVGNGFASRSGCSG